MPIATTDLFCEEWNRHSKMTGLFSSCTICSDSVMLCLWVVHVKSGSQEKATTFLTPAAACARAKSSRCLFTVSLAVAMPLRGRQGSSFKSSNASNPSHSSREEYCFLSSAASLQSFWKSWNVFQIDNNASRVLNNKIVNEENKNRVTSWTLPVNQSWKVPLFFQFGFIFLIILSSCGSSVLTGWVACVGQ